MAIMLNTTHNNLVLHSKVKDVFAYERILFDCVHKRSIDVICNYALQETVTNLLKYIT